MLKKFYTHLNHLVCLLIYSNKRISINMGKRVVYVIIGLIVAVILIAVCFWNAPVKKYALLIERKISQQIETALQD